MSEDPRLIEPIIVEKMIYLFEKTAGRRFDFLNDGDPLEISEDEVKNYQPKNNIERAQLLVYAGYEEDNLEKMREAAMNALKLDNLCCDAYTLLGFAEVDDTNKALEYFKMGETLFRQRFSEEFFRKNEGEFMNIVETMPYMRNLNYTILTQEMLSHYDDAIETAKLMLRLNKEDSMKIKNRLVMIYIMKDDIENLMTLLERVEPENFNESEILFGASFISYFYYQDKTATLKYANALFESNTYLNDFFSSGKVPTSDISGRLPSEEESDAREFLTMFSRVFSENMEKTKEWMTFLRESYVGLPLKKHSADIHKQKNRRKMAKASRRKNKKK
jgi:tetratricopeptide (TPR) repeat protein